MPPGRHRDRHRRGPRQRSGGSGWAHAAGHEWSWHSGSAGGGGDLSNSTAFNCLINKLIPLASIITPNSLEARALTSNTENLAQCAEQLLNNGCKSVLITGEHEDSIDVSNTLYTGEQQIKQSWPRLPGKYHGSGCTLSASIAAFLAIHSGFKDLSAFSKT